MDIVPSLEETKPPVVPTEEESGEDARVVSTGMTGISGFPASVPHETEAPHAIEDVAEICDEEEQGDDEDDESEYEYEDDDDAAFSGFLVQEPKQEESHVIEEEDEPRKKWREPSRQAVDMSLRAERETSGGKRRLAQDLYRIMNQDTEEAGFSIAPKSDDSMDIWTIKLFQFDEDSNLAKDMIVLGIESIELEMTFPDQYPFEPPFVRVVRPRFRRQTGFVMNGALCMELLTKDGWNPINDIESVIVSIRSLLVVGDGRLQAAYEMADSKYQARLDAEKEKNDSRKRQRSDPQDNKKTQPSKLPKEQAGTYSMAEAQAAYSHLSDYHKKKGWDSSGWWARKG